MAKAQTYKLERPVEELVLYEKVEPHIAKVVLNRPEKHNAFYMPDSLVELSRKLRMAFDDDEVKVIILAGNGPSFCTGDDLNISPYESFGAEPGVKPGQSQRIRGIQRAAEPFKLILESPKVIIGQVQGWAIGGGVEILAGCDLVIAAQNAKFGQYEQRIGFAGWEPYVHLIQMLLIGPRKYREWLLTGKALTADEAKEWGLINEVVPDDKLEEETLKWARTIALHSTDGLMVGKIVNQLCYDMLGVHNMCTATYLAHPLFTNLKWRDDELNFLKVRDKAGIRDAFRQREEMWEKNLPK